MSLEYTTVIPLTKLDDLSINKAYKIFNSYKKAGIILSSNWDSNIWYTTNEYANTGLNFELDTSKKVILGLKKDDFINYLKTYICYLLGNISLISIQTCINRIKDVSITHDLSSIYLDNENRIEEFLSILPNANNDEIEEILEYLDNLEEKELLKGKRELASFESYFLFNDILDRYWSEECDENNKLFYFPIYMWWKVTAIIPERPREFILTPRDCLKKVDKRYFIKLRKDKLKGSNKSVSYKINDDFDVFEYQIPEKLANEIIWYIDKTNDLVDSELNTLFVMNTHYQLFGRSPGLRNRFLTYANFNTILKSFYMNIIHDLYGYEIIADRSKKYLNSNQIQYIRLGDTRHIALINIIAEGGTPIVAMQLAGHNNINITFAYASNVSKMVECKTYRYLNGISGYAISEPMEIVVPKKYTLVGQTPCGYENISKKDFSKCVNAVSKNGKIGDCNNCPLSRGIKHVNDPKQEVENNVIFLINTLNQVRNNKGNIEDILYAFSKLATANYSYQQYLLEKENNYGK